MQSFTARAGCCNCGIVVVLFSLAMALAVPLPSSAAVQPHHGRPQPTAPKPSPGKPHANPKPPTNTFAGGFGGYGYKGGNLGAVGGGVFGYGYKGGFVSHAKTPLMENVGCENCHHAGGRHAAAPATVRPPKVGSAACAACHVPEHSPGFQFAQFWAKIRH